MDSIFSETLQQGEKKGAAFRQQVGHKTLTGPVRINIQPTLFHENAHKNL